jgi:hypothetical protein
MALAASPIAVRGAWLPVARAQVVDRRDFALLASALEGRGERRLFCVDGRVVADDLVGADLDLAVARGNRIEERLDLADTRGNLRLPGVDQRLVGGDVERYRVPSSPRC